MGDVDSASIAKCSQCDKPAAVKYGDLGLCVEHHLMMQQAQYLYMSMLAATQNLLADQIDAGTGYLVPTSRIRMPRPPFIGDSLHLSNINVSGSTIGAINTGTIRNLDASITVMQSQGKSELAKAVNELAEAIIRNTEVSSTARNEMAEQLAFLMAQVTTEPANRSMGLVKSILAGLRDAISVSAGLLTIWDKVEPLLRSAFGM